MAGPLERFLQIIGTVMDSTKTEIERLLDNYDVADTDAALIPYIDSLLGWPTNFDLSELKRREETLNAITIYQQKGRKSALETLVEGIADWDATTHEGWRYVMFSNDTRCLTPTTSVSVGLIGTIDDELKYTPTQDNWHCLNGLLLELQPVEGLTDELVAVTARKILRLAPELTTSWALLALLLNPPVATETIDAPTDTHFLGGFATLDPETIASPGEASTATWSGITLMVSNTVARVTNDQLVRVPHSNLGYSGTAPPPAYSAGP